MRKCYLAFLFLFLIAALLLSVKTNAVGFFPDSAPAISAESTARPSIETITMPSAEAISTISFEVITSKPSTEVITMPTTEASTSESTGAGYVEGTSYKGVPWGADFSAFKTIKNFAGTLSPFSAAFIGSTDDNDIAMLLGVPVAGKDSNGQQRVMFEYVPQKFSSVYYEPDDTYYIFYNGKFVLTFSRINDKNFDLYRDTFYKKYKKVGSFSARYELGEKKSYLLQAAVFEKGKTTAFLIKSQLSSKKNNFVSAKLVFAFSDMLGPIRKEIRDKMAADKLTGNARNKFEMEKDLNKIE